MFETKIRKNKGGRPYSPITVDKYGTFSYSDKATIAEMDDRNRMFEKLRVKFGCTTMTELSAKLGCPATMIYSAKRRDTMNKHTWYNHIRMLQLLLNSQAGSWGTPMSEESQVKRWSDIRFKYFQKGWTLQQMAEFHGVCKGLTYFSEEKLHSMSYGSVEVMIERFTLGMLFIEEVDNGTGTGEISEAARDRINLNCAEDVLREFGL